MDKLFNDKDQIEPSMFVYNIFFFLSRKFRIIAPKTKSFVLRSLFYGDTWGSPYNFNLWKSDKWRSLLLYVILSCQKAETVKICFSDIIVEEKQTPNFIEIMKWIISWFVDDVLPLTSTDCQLCLKLQFAISNAIYVSF